MKGGDAYDCVPMTVGPVSYTHLVEETLNELLEKEAESLTQAARYERSEGRQGYRSGHYDRNLTTTSGDVTLHMPRLKGVSFETATPGGIAAGRAAWRRL